MNRQAREANRGGGVVVEEGREGLGGDRGRLPAWGEGDADLERLAQAGVGEALGGVFGGVAAELHGVVGVSHGGLPVLSPCSRV